MAKKTGSKPIKLTVLGTLNPELPTSMDDLLDFQRSDKLNRRGKPRKLDKKGPPGTLAHCCWCDQPLYEHSRAQMFEYGLSDGYR